MKSEGAPAATARGRPLEIVEESEREEPLRAACPVCGGRLLDIHRKLICMQCHSIIETCCD